MIDNGSQIEGVGSQKKAPPIVNKAATMLEASLALPGQAKLTRAAEAERAIEDARQLSVIAKANAAKNQMLNDGAVVTTLRILPKK